MSQSQSSQPLTPQEKVLLQELLARAGISSEEVEPSTPGSFSIVEAQSMSDASKRRGDDPGGRVWLQACPYR